MKVEEGLLRRGGTWISNIGIVAEKQYNQNTCEHIGKWHSKAHFVKLIFSNKKL